MDDAVRHLLAVCENNMKKHQGRKYSSCELVRQRLNTVLEKNSENG
jgi:hypothetical protein